jgi:Spindle and kinetochore-associated protein 1
VIVVCTMSSALTPPKDVGGLLNTFVIGLGRETRLLQRLAALRTRTEDTAMRERMAPLFTAVDGAISTLEKAVDALAAFQKAQQAHAATTAGRVASIKAHRDMIMRRVSGIREQLPADALAQVHSKGGMWLAESTTTRNRDGSAKQANNHNNPGTQRLENSGRQQLQNPCAQENMPSSNVKNAMQAGAGARKNSGTSTGREKHLAPRHPHHKDEHFSRCDENADRGLEAQAGAPGTPFIRNMTEAELQDAPQYVKGRMTIARMATVVAALNKVVGAKYALLARPLRSLNSQEVNRWHEVTSIETDCAELQGRQFFTDADLRHEGVSLDSAAKSVINLLRHVSVLKEVRGKNRVRIFIVTGE